MYEKLKTFLLKQTPETRSKKPKATKEDDLLKKKQELLVHILSRMRNLDVYLNVNENFEQDPGSYRDRLKNAHGDLSLFYSAEDSTVCDEFAVETFRKLLSPQYNPPSDPIALRTDLQILFDYYMAVLPYLKNIPHGLEARIDFVMTQAACAAAECIHVIDKVGPEQDGIHARRKRKGEIRNAAAQDVLDIFYRLDDHKKFTFNGLAKKIRSHLSEKKQQRLAHLQGKALEKENRKKVRSISSIKRDLLNDPRTKAILTRDKLIN